MRVQYTAIGCNRLRELALGYIRLCRRQRWSFSGFSSYRRPLFRPRSGLPVEEFIVFSACYDIGPSGEVHTLAHDNGPLTCLPVWPWGQCAGE